MPSKPILEEPPWTEPPDYDVRPPELARAIATANAAGVPKAEESCR